MLRKQKNENMNKIIEVENISKSFDGEVVLDNISLDIYDNAFVAFGREE